MPHVWLVRLRRIAGDTKSITGRESQYPSHLRVANEPQKWKNALIHWALIAHGSIDRCRASLSFDFLAGLVAGPGAILFRVTCVFAGLHFEPCVPPVLLTLAGIVPREASIMNLIHTSSGSNAF
jgi:hypothetical protein